MKQILFKSLLVAFSFVILTVPTRIYAEIDCFDTDQYDRTACTRIGDTCLAQCGIGLDFKNNAWIPVGSDPNPQDCSSIGYFDSYGIERKIDLNQNSYVRVEKAYNSQLISFCNKGSTITATSAGELIIYGFKSENVNNDGYLSIKVNGKTKYSGTLKNFPVSTGINLQVQDQIEIIAASYSYSVGPGWRVFTDPNLLNQANAAGDLPLIGQTWSDSITTSIYDSYDFNDISILPAIRRTTSCTDLTVTLNVENDLEKILLSETAKLRISISSNPQNLTYQSISNSFINTVINSGCNPSILNTTYDCQVLNKGDTGNPTSATWRNVYKVCNGSVCSSNCTIEKTFNIFPYPGIMNTNNGNVYIGKPSLDANPAALLKQTRFVNYFNASNKLLRVSTFNFGVATQNLSSHIPSSAEMLSKQNYILEKYKDSNHYENVYNRFASKIRSNYQTQNIVTYNNNTTLTLADFQRFNVENIQLVDVLGNSNLTIPSDITCNSKTIFLVEGDLIITPNFETEGDNACLFLAKGKVTILSNSGDSKDDLIQAFIISDELTSASSNQKLTIFGGVISRSTIFDKNVNLNVLNMNNIQKTVSSETINYEGARYIKHFGEILSNPFLLSIREKQYIK